MTPCCRAGTCEEIFQPRPARKNLKRYRRKGRSHFRVADVLERPDAVTPAAIVILNRVVCCSPDGVQLTGTAARLAERILILSFPRDRWLVRAFIRVVNGAQRLMGKSFRVFLHPEASLHAAAQAQGLSLAESGRNIAWEFVVLRRAH